MVITLTSDLFTNGEYSTIFSNGHKQAHFRIVHDDFSSGGRTITLNKVLIIIVTYGANGEEISRVIGSSIIGVGDTVVGVKSDYTELLGKELNEDNMSKCTVILYEDS